MATVNYAEQPYLLDHLNFTWSPLTTTNADGQPTSYAGSGQRTIQITGTWGTGGTCVVQGSADGVNWFTLVDPAGANLSLTANGYKAIRDDVVFVRPLVTAGDGTTSLTAILAVRKNLLG